MTDELIGTSSISDNDSGSPQVTVPAGVREYMGIPKQLVWFRDLDTGHVYVVPAAEVVPE